MGIFKKFADLARANINSLIDQLEDPKKMAHQAIFDLEESKKKAQQLLIKTMAAKKMVEAKIIRLGQDAAGLAQEAERFLMNNREEDAKGALAKKNAALEEEAFAQQQVEQETKTISIINRGILAIDEKISSLKANASVVAGKNVLEKDDAFATFSRMEEKIESMEFEVQALNELLASEEKKDVEAKPTAPTSFDKHSDPAALEKELSAMKKKLSDS